MYLPAARDPLPIWAGLIRHWSRLAAPSDLVDLSRMKELQGVKVSGKTATIGSSTTHYAVANDEKLKKACPTLAIWCHRCRYRR